MAMLLKDTNKSFSLEITGNAVSLNLENVYMPVGVENALWEDDENPDISLRRNEFKINDQTVFYYTLIMKLPSGDYDCFMMAVDLAMILDANITVSSAAACRFIHRSLSVFPPFLWNKLAIFTASTVYW